MKYQCPFCESFDVHKNDTGEIVCFECFSICSAHYNLTSIDPEDLPPPFPTELERRKRVKKTRSEREGMDFDRFVKRLV